MGQNRVWQTRLPRRAVRADPAGGAAAVVELPAPARSPVPREWNFARFPEAVEAVEAETGRVTGMVDTPRERLKRAGRRAGERGRVARIDLDKVDRRIFTPTPHGSPS